ncbi:putative Ecp7(P20) [Drepanopeziza brunnea f. sp. 'multigermtubi' MB_m1]|uniref:Ecp8 n=2 Tax=Drepanopeziza brunnea f. sp. 'multigermtubi' TaxID=698441 RepID=D2XTC0_9HELO|nr:putative Ecp7(P20) [Drepanopeziza brunnea f. sp. 'multigermtubi' MB_m1]ADB23419.1 Ecp8 [Drepanopeziza brunnea f. sp. 'multigermtubi']EKD12338.1 putative Ecp7(P20) [Drepanopeziza brunnea f. sp. 'multigermtubi' MB_m1]
MHSNNNLLLLAFFGAATALRRTCAVDNVQNDGTGTYIITDFDTLPVIAADFCTEVPELEKLNSAPQIEAGDSFTVPCRVRKRDCLRIPNSKVGYYTVVEGDTLAYIASDFCVAASRLPTMNPGVITDNSVSPGMIIEVPCSWN